MLTDGIEYIVEALPDGRRFTAKSILKLTPKKEHHNTTFTCQAQNTADRTYRSAKLRLEVKYAPKVRNSSIVVLVKTIATLNKILFLKIYLVDYSRSLSYYWMKMLYKFITNIPRNM